MPWVDEAFEDGLNERSESSDHTIEHTKPRLPLRSLHHPNFVLEIRPMYLAVILENFAERTPELDPSAKFDQPGQ